MIYPFCSFLFLSYNKLVIINIIPSLTTVKIKLPLLIRKYSSIGLHIIVANINNNIENNSVATFEVILRDTNDKVKYNVNVQNNGTIDAKIGSIMLVPDNNYVKFSLENVNAEDVIKSGESKNFSLIATYNVENTDNGVLPVHCKLNLILDIVQK